MSSRAEMVEPEERGYNADVTLLASRDYELVAAARAALCASGNVAPVVEGLGRPEWRVRANCLNILSHLCDKDPDGRIAAALLDLMSGVRREAIHALVRLKRKGFTWNEDVERRLIKMVRHDPVSHVRRVAAQALGIHPRGVGAEAAVRHLLSEENDSRVRYNARWAFDPDERRQISQARSRKERRACSEAHQEELGQRLNLEARTSEELVELLASSEAGCVGLAQEELSRRGKDAMEPMLAGLSYPDSRVRASCSGLMDHLGDSRCVLPLTGAMQDACVHVRRMALHSLSCRPCKDEPLTGDLVGPVIDRALHDPNRRVRHVATLALAGLEYDPRAVEALEQILDTTSDPVLQSRARQSLERQEKARQDAAGCKLNL